MTTETTNQFPIDQLIEYMQSVMGINPFTIYCQLTGKPIGRIQPDELEPFLVGGSDNIEEIADDLFIRLIASMRPSIHWNVMREDSLNTLAKSRPTETLAYLMNRLFQPVDFHKLPIAARLEDQHQRIRLYDFITRMDSSTHSELYAMLIEVDAKMNLSVQRINLRPTDFMLFLDDSMEIIRDFYADCMKRWTRNQKNEEDSRRWFKGNTIARPAFFTSFMEAKPESKTAKIKRVKKERDTEIDALFDAVMAELPADKPIAIPTITAPKSHAGKVPAFLIRKAS